MINKTTIAPSTATASRDRKGAVRPDTRPRMAGDADRRTIQPHDRALTSAARLVAVCLAVLLMAGGAWADDEASLDDLLGLEEEQQEEAAEDGDEAEMEEGEADVDVAPELPDTADLEDLALPTEQEGDAFELAVTDMKAAAERLTGGEGAAGDASIETQRVQERVIRRLDQVISSAQRQQQEGGGGGGGSSDQQDTGSEQNAAQRQQQAGGQAGSDEPASEGGSRGSVERGEMEDEPLNERLSEWGNLPPRVRDQVMQGMEDSFSQLYRQLTEQYYERLAEQQE